MKKGEQGYKIVFVLGVFFALLLTWAFFQMAAVDLQNSLELFSEGIKVRSAEFSAPIKLKKGVDHLLKIKYELGCTITEEAYLNRHNLELRSGNWSKNLSTHWYYVPKQILDSEGKNVLVLKFYPKAPRSIDIKVSNYITSLANGYIVLGLKTDALGGAGVAYLFKLFLGLCFFAMIFLLWDRAVYFGVRPLSLAVYNNVLSFMPLLVFFVFFAAVSAKGPYSLYVEPAYLFFLAIFLVTFGSVFCNALFYLLVRLMPEEKTLKCKFSFPGKHLLIHVSRLEFHRKCIVFFMVLFFVSGLLLMTGLIGWAHKTANVALAALLLGAVLKILKKK